MILTGNILDIYLLKLLAEITHNCIVSNQVSSRLNINYNKSLKKIFKVNSHLGNMPESTRRNTSN